MRFLKVLSLMFAPLAMPTSTAWAMNSGPGTVIRINVEAPGVAIVTVSGPTSGTWPACASLQRYAVNASTAAGQAIYAAILSAKMAGQKITVTGAGNCSIWGDSETIATMSVEP
jgi:hypothetical protein